MAKGAGYISGNRAARNVGVYNKLVVQRNSALEKAYGKGGTSKDMQRFNALDTKLKKATRTSAAIQREKKKRIDREVNGPKRKPESGRISANSGTPWMTRGRRG